MTFVDADALLRYLTRDDPAKAERVRLRLAGEALVVTVGTLAEVGYVLQSWFKYPRPTIVQALQTLLAEPNLTVLGVDEQRVVAALALCAPSGRVSFCDALLWAQAGEAQNSKVLTFDRRFPTRHPDPIWGMLFSAVLTEEP